MVPGALLAVADELQSSEEELIDALLVMGGVGIVSAAQGPISGAEGDVSPSAVWLRLWPQGRLFI